MARKPTRIVFAGMKIVAAGAQHDAAKERSSAAEHSAHVEAAGRIIHSDHPIVVGVLLDQCRTLVVRRSIDDPSATSLHNQNVFSGRDAGVSKRGPASTATHYDGVEVKVHDAFERRTGNVLSNLPSSVMRGIRCVRIRKAPRLLASSASAKFESIDRRFSASFPSRAKALNL